MLHATLNPLKLHRENNIAVTNIVNDPRSPEDNIDEEEWWLNGKRHRINKLPAYTNTIAGDKVSFWWQYGITYRISGPTRVELILNRDEKPIKKTEYWYLNGEIHRDNGPAEISKFYNKDGLLNYKEIWYRRGELHRENGPAVYYITKNGDLKLTTAEYYFHGKRVKNLEKLKLIVANNN